MNATAKQPRRNDQAMPFHTYVSQLLDANQVKNVDVAEALGYKPNVIAMLRNGSMKVPPNKVRPLARILDMDPIALLMRLLSAYHPELLEALEGADFPIVTPNEMALLQVIRSRTAGVDIDFIANDEFVSRLEMMATMAFDRQVKGEVAALKVGKRESSITAANRELAELLERQAAEREEFYKRSHVNRSLSRAA